MLTDSFYSYYAKKYVRKGVITMLKNKEHFYKWLKAAGVRAIKTVAQTALGMITVGAAVEDVNWLYVGSVALVAGIYSMLTSIAGLPEVEEKEGE